MFSGTIQLKALIVAILMIFTIPTIAGTDQHMMEKEMQFNEDPNNSSDQAQDDGRVWVVEIPVQTPRPAPSDRPWWELTSRDSNRNGIVDSLEGENEEEQPLILSYSRPITERDLETLNELGVQGGYVVAAIDAISIGIVDSCLIPELASLEGVVMVETSGRVHLLSDVATRALKARGSEEYSPSSAWEFNELDGYGINIAVVDTGIDDGHPSLAGKRVAGYDAVTPGARSDGQGNPDDRNGHGTSCSGMATGTSAGDPELSYMGSAPGASLLDVQIGTDIGAGPFENYILPTTYIDSALKGIEWVKDNAHNEWDWVEAEHYGIDVMSLSWSIASTDNGKSDGSDPFSRLIDEVVAEGVVCVGAAGNDGPNNDGMDGMAASSEAIIVGATDDHNTIDRTDDTIAGYSSRGPRKDDGDGYPYDELKPDISAPGTNIWNTDPCVTSEGCYGDAEGHGYEARGSGTSYATPAVAGVTALILHANPELSPAQVKGILHQTSERRGEATFPELDPFWNRDFGYGMVDAYEAVKLATKLLDEDLEAMDVELQAHVTNISETVSGGAIIEGLAWAKVGTLERVEISLDGKEWQEVLYLEADGPGETGEFVQWQFEIHSSHLSWTGEHSFQVRSVSEESQSLPTFGSFNGKKSRSEDSGLGAMGMALISSLSLTLLLVAAVALTKRRNEIMDPVPDAEMEGEPEGISYDESVEMEQSPGTP